MLHRTFYLSQHITLAAFATPTPLTRHVPLACRRKLLSSETPLPAMIRSRWPSSAASSRRMPPESLEDLPKEAPGQVTLRQAGARSTAHAVVRVARSIGGQLLRRARVGDRVRGCAGRRSVRTRGGACHRARGLRAVGGLPAGSSAWRALAGAGRVRGARRARGAGRGRRAAGGARAVGPVGQGVLGRGRVPLGAVAGLGVHGARGHPLQQAGSGRARRRWGAAPGVPRRRVGAVCHRRRRGLPTDDSSGARCADLGHTQVGRME